MSTDFCTSKTKINLMRSFAGESQAKNRYEFAQAQAERAKLHVLAALYKFTANQEKAHAQVFYDHLKECAGESIEIDAGYPVDINDDIFALTEKAASNETKEADSVYPEFAKTARDEGFAKIAQDFENIAKIEHWHAERFNTFVQLNKNGRLFSSDKTERWMCLNCGFILESDSAPQNCPVCSSEQGYFIRLQMSDWGVSIKQ